MSSSDPSGVAAPQFVARKIGRPPLGIRLWLRPGKRPAKARWVILDGPRQISTGFGEVDRIAAEQAMQRYIAQKDAPRRGRPTTYQSQTAIRLFEAKRRAAKAGLPFDLTLEFLNGLQVAQNNSCALTGIPFAPSKGGRNNPYVLSLDRIDSSRGYTQDNVRLVIFAMNAALGPWGEAVFEEVAKAYLARRK